MAEFELRDVVAPIGKYTNREGEEKTEYIKIGTARVSEHGSQIQLFIKSTPLGWDGRAYVNKPYEKKGDGDKPMTQAQALNGGKDVVPQDIDDRPIDLSEIPF